MIKLLKTNHRLKAFNLGNIISDDTDIKGTNILPTPPINIRIIIEGIINIPWNVILGLYWRDEHAIKRNNIMNKGFWFTAFSINHE